MSDRPVVAVLGASGFIGSVVAAAQHRAQVVPVERGDALVDLEHPGDQLAQLPVGPAVLQQQPAHGLLGQPARRWST